MNFRIYITFFLIIGFCQLGFSQIGNNDDVAIINFSKNKQNQGSFLKDWLTSYFKNSDYFSVENENLVDSLNSCHEKVIKIERRWYRKYNNNWHDCFDDCWFWTLNTKVSIKNDVEFQFILENLDNQDQYLEIIKKYNSPPREIGFGQRIYIYKSIEKDNIDHYIDQLIKEFGKERIVVVTTVKGEIQRINEQALYTIVKFFLKGKDNFIAEFEDPDSGRILRSDEIN